MHIIDTCTLRQGGKTLEADAYLSNASSPIAACRMGHIRSAVKLLYRADRRDGRHLHVLCISIFVERRIKEGGGTYCMAFARRLQPPRAELPVNLWD